VLSFHGHVSSHNVFYHSKSTTKPWLCKKNFQLEVTKYQELRMLKNGWILVERWLVISWKLVGFWLEFGRNTTLNRRQNMTSKKLSNSTKIRRPSNVGVQRLFTVYSTSCACWVVHIKLFDHWNWSTATYFIFTQRLHV